MHSRSSDDYNCLSGTATAELYKAVNLPSYRQQNYFLHSALPIYLKDSYRCARTRARRSRLCLCIV